MSDRYQRRNGVLHKRPALVVAKAIWQIIRSIGIRTRKRSQMLACVTLLTGATAMAAEPLTVSGMREDLEVLIDALEEAHGGMYRFTERHLLHRRFDSIRDGIGETTDRMEFIGLVSELVASIRDGHLRVRLDDETRAQLTEAPLLPFQLMYEGDALVVISNLTADDSTVRPGMTLTQVNGWSVDDIRAAILPKLSGDGMIETGKRKRLAEYFGQYFWLYLDRSRTFRVAARDASGRSVTAVLPGVMLGEQNRKRNPVNSDIVEGLKRIAAPAGQINTRFIGSGQIAHLRINGFGGDDFPSEIEMVFDDLHDRGTEALVLDLRGNAGGVDEYGALLVSQFVSHAFRYFDRIVVRTIDPSFTSWIPSTYTELRKGTIKDPSGIFLVTSDLHQGVARQSPANSPFLGPLVVLVDGGTFSTAADVAAQLRSLRRATFVGEETGGTYEGNTSGLNADVQLPNSGLTVRVSMYGYWNAVVAQEGGRGTQPDHLIAVRFADLKMGVDVPLRHAIDILQESLSLQPGE